MHNLESTHSVVFSSVFSRDVSAPAKYSRPMRAVAACAALVLLATPSLSAQVTQTAGDAYGQSSLNTATNWSDGLAPSAGKTYETSLLLRTPTAAGNYTFAGDSLALNSGADFFYKGVNGYAITANLIFNGGSINNGRVSAFTLAGTVRLDATSTIYATVEKLTIDSLITGGANAQLLIRTVGMPTADLTGGTVLSNSANSYAGGTMIHNSAALHAVADGVLGSGDVIMNKGSSLYLSGGTNHRYISSTASLIMASDANGVFLDFMGTNSIAALSLDGGNTFLNAGTYGSIGSGADFEYAIFNGTGTFTVVPESSTVALLVGAMAGAVVLLRRRRTHR